MATTVSQVKFWLDPSGFNNSGAEGADAGTYLSYEVFLLLSVLGGFFGLDHLYLRSPFTFLAKFFVNIFCFGVWWLWDATQAVFNADVVKVYGLGLPGWGPVGIGAGVLSKPVPDKKHARFLLYSLALFFGGLIGMDSFITGDRQFGIIRLLCAVSFILLPVSGFEWASNLFNYFTDTESVIDEHHEFFGAPHRSLSNRMRSRFPLLGWLFSPFESIKNFINGTFGAAIVQPITQSIDAVTGTVEKAVSAVDNTVQLGREAIQKSGEIVDQVGQVVESVSQASTLMPAASLYAAAQGGLKGPGPTQSGGGGSAPSGDSLNRSGFVFLATLAVLAVSGFVLTLYRKRNERERGQEPTTQRDDSPPQPGVLPGADGTR